MTISVTPGQRIQVRTVAKVGAVPARPWVCSQVPSTPQPMSAADEQARADAQAHDGAGADHQESVWKPRVRAPTSPRTLADLLGDSGFFSAAVTGLAMPDDAREELHPPPPAMAPHSSASAFLPRLAGRGVQRADGLGVGQALGERAGGRRR